jgi:hypothetical protein
VVRGGFGLVVGCLADLGVLSFACEHNLLYYWHLYAPDGVVLVVFVGSNVFF